MTRLIFFKFFKKFTSKLLRKKLFNIDIDTGKVFKSIELFESMFKRGNKSEKANNSNNITIAVKIKKNKKDIKNIDGSIDIKFNTFLIYIIFFYLNHLLFV